MVKHLIRFVVLMALVGAGLWGLGLALARRFEQGEGYPGSDQFRIAAYWGGREFTSTSTALRSGWAVAVLGGIALDLRDCQLADEGAKLTLRATAGGIAVVVPDGWRVEVERNLQGGDIQVDVPDPDGLPDDAPTLTIVATALGAGIVVKAKDAAPVPK